MTSWLFSLLFMTIFVFSYIETKQCDSFKDNDRFDCYPDPGSNQNDCQSRGCCWQTAVTSDDLNVPYCFFPRDFPTYSVTSVQSNGSSNSPTVMTLSRTGSSGRPNDIAKLKLTISSEGASRLRMRFEDATKQRWEPPIPLDPVSDPKADSDMDVTVRKSPFGITVKRKKDQRLLFDTASIAAPLIFSDQFLQLSTKLATNRVYGLGEHRANFTYDLSSGWRSIAFWARDQPPTPNANLYGTHNFMLGLFDDGSAYGVFFLNSNAQEVILQPLPAITYRTIGGILDFFIFSGPTPMSVVQQYNRLIGFPILPPYWALGFHLSRYGYGSLAEVNTTLERNLAAKIPLDVMWNDIDYMDKYRDWTYDKTKYQDLPGFVQQLHGLKMRYVIIVDPGISNTSPGQYPPYDTGLAAQVFMLNADRSGPIVGKVWPGNTVFPDFTAPQTTSWWYDQAKSFHDQVPYDGLWIDMNEPSSFTDGSIVGCSKSNKLDYPPYTPGVLGNSLPQKTVCPSALQNISSHYNLHNMYGYFEAKVTNLALTKVIPNVRPFILTRSSFAGSGRYTFHWTGDNQATWGDLRYSIDQVLNFNLFGIPMVGADICGFLGNTNAELCTRWMQVGAFYPFMRNHNTLGAKEQDPAVWDKATQDAMRSVLELRYTLLPYLYTQLFLASTQGVAVARALMLEFPTDAATHSIDSQFLVGPALLISPVLTSGARFVPAYLPKGRWCDVQTGLSIESQGGIFTLNASLDHINVHLRGGHLILTKPSGPNTEAQRMAPYSLRACLDDAETATGQLFTDALESQLNQLKYNNISFSIQNRQLVSFASWKNGGVSILSSLWISGVKNPVPTKLLVNGQMTKFQYDSKTTILQVPSLQVDLRDNLTVAWS